MPIYDVEIDALYFDARETGVSYALVDERVLNPNFNQRFGARARIGVEIGEDSWELSLQFLHYHARTTNGENGAITPSWGFSRGAVDNVFNLWRLHLGFLDLSLAKSWWATTHLEITPMVSFRYAEVRHKLRIEYWDANVFYEDSSFKNKFLGIGPGIGLESVWHLIDCIGIYSRGGFHLIYGQFYIHQDVGMMKFFNRFWQTQGMFETAIGLDIHLGLFTARIGFELYLLMGQNQLARFVNQEMPGKFVSNLGDLSMQGLTFGAGLNF